MKKNLRQIIGSSLLAMSIITQAIIPPLTAFAETVNADGSITKTATAEYEECDGGWVEHCSGGGTRTCPGGSTTDEYGESTCSCGAITIQTFGRTTCDECGAMLYAYTSGIGAYQRPYTSKDF